MNGGRCFAPLDRYGRRMRKSGTSVLVAASLVSAVLGSLHAFSVFLVPLEQMLGLGRGTVSLVYSFALVVLTLTVFFGPRIYGRFSPAVIYLAVALLGALGAVAAGWASSFWGVWLGYSLFFGVANGLGYGFGLQHAARANPERAGWAMGVVTAAYASGAALAPLGFERAVAEGGFFLAMIGLATAVLVVGVLAAWMVFRAGVSYQSRVRAVGGVLPAARIVWLWVGYGAGVAAGLMAIGHAAGIAEAAGATGWLAAAVLACCNLAGSLVAGTLADRVSMRRLLSALPLMTALSLIGLVLFMGQTLVFLGLIGFAYGGTIAAYPAAIAQEFGEQGPRAYGRVFTAWGTAGLFAPWLAGQIFDWSGGYDLALSMASGLAAISILVALLIFRRNGAMNAM